jgi:hypothetical protein
MGEDGAQVHDEAQVGSSRHIPSAEVAMSAFTRFARRPDSAGVAERAALAVLDRRAAGKPFASSW